MAYNTDLFWEYDNNLILKRQGLIHETRRSRKKQQHARATRDGRFAPQNTQLFPNVSIIWIKKYSDCLQTMGMRR